MKWATAVAGVWMLVLGAVEAHAQTRILCATTTGRRAPAGLDLFAGEYTLKNVASADQTDPRALGGVKSIRIPETVGHIGFGGYRREFHGNFSFNNAERIRMEWHQPEGNGPADMEDDLLEARNAGWCTNDDPGVFYLRGGISQDWRFRGVLSIGSVIGISDKRRYVGVRTISELIPGRGFPVQKYRVESGREEAAERSADRLYRERDAQQAMAFSTYEMELWGYLRRKQVVEPARCLRSPCYLRNGRRHPRNWSSERTRTEYQRGLIGELRRRQYNDARLGIAGHTQGGVQWEMTVEFVGEPLTSSNTSTMRRITSAVRRFCGSEAGCEQMPPLQVARGGVRIAGSDDRARLEQLCAAYNGTRQNCMGPGNTALPSMTPTASRLHEVLTTRGRTGAPQTDQQRRQTHSGRRASVSSSSVPSQWDRRCRRLIEQDSIDRANAPRPAGGQPEPIPSQVPPECR